MQADAQSTTRTSSLPSIYLASQSPRRQMLLTQAGVVFTVLPLNATGFGSVLEVRRADETPAAYVRRMARAKAIVGMRQVRLRHLPILPVLGADTEVILNDRVYGKPVDRNDAAAMLRSLSGVTHQVITACALCRPPGVFGGTDGVSVASAVTFKSLSEAEIRRYLDSGEWQGKAGAYAIQGDAGAFVQELEGSFSAVVGLPVEATLKLLDALPILQL